MRDRWLLTLGLTAVLACATASAQTRRALDICVVDVEGGNATIKISASEDGTCTVTNARNGFTKTCRKSQVY